MADLTDTNDQVTCNQMIEHLTRRPAPRTHIGGVLQYENSPQGFDAYLRDLGITNTNAKEVFGKWRRPEIAKNLGMQSSPWPYMQPMWWPRAGLILSIWQHIRTSIGAPIVITNYLRPEPYNTGVSGARASSHLRGYAIDTSYRSIQDSHEAYLIAKELQHLYHLGIGFKTVLDDGVPKRCLVHLDANSPSGTRSWEYT